VDANFEQKRCSNAGKSDQPIVAPRSFFLSEETLANARKDLEERRKASQKKPKYNNNNPISGLKMPDHLYEGCVSRFIAADESQAKAEAGVFSDTGLMALVCRHTRVIFFANLRDAGEKQFNVIALLEELFQELPSMWRVGVLYDIGCQLHNSILKVLISPYR
jgi:hypothetical protein